MTISPGAEAAATALKALRDTLTEVAPGRPAVVTIGKFDGVHLGHRQLVETACRRAEVLDAVPGVLTFDPLPYVVFNPDKPFRYLCSLPQRVERLRALGVGFVGVLPFSRAMAQLPARDFVQALVEVLQLTELVVGPDAAIGHDREGTVDRLRAFGRELGFGVTQVAPVLVDGAIVRSSLIRHALWTGDVAAAGRLLGQPYTLEGTIIGGDQRGRELGFPTANILPPEHRILPMDGIYGCWADVGGERHKAAVNIGVRPTFGSDLHRLIEAYLLDFSGDLYGKRMTLSFVHRVRGEERFASAEALVERMTKDVAEVRATLS